MNLLFAPKCVVLFFVKTDWVFCRTKMSVSALRIIFIRNRLAVLFTCTHVKEIFSSGRGLTSGILVPLSRNILHPSSLSRVVPVHLMKVYVICYLYLANSNSSKYLGEILANLRLRWAQISVCSFVFLRLKCKTKSNIKWQMFLCATVYIDLHVHELISIK